MYNGMPFYTLGNVSKASIIPESAQLYRGINQWKCEVYPHNWGYAHQPGISDWTILPSTIDTNNILTSYIDMDFVKESPTGTELLFADVPHGNFRWSTSLYCDDSTTINTDLSMSGNGGQILVLVNGAEAKKINIAAGVSKPITYTLLRGWNSVQILFYNNGDVDTIINPGSIS